MNSILLCLGTRGVAVRPCGFFVPLACRALATAPAPVYPALRKDDPFAGILWDGTMPDTRFLSHETQFVAKRRQYNAALHLIRKK